MKKIINKPENFILEMLEGVYVSNSNIVKYVNDDLHCAVAVSKTDGKVGLASGGGSGHLPLFLGYVGQGMLDGVSIGDVFQSPSADQMLTVTKEIDSGAGVLYVYGNYNGDIFSFDMSAEMAAFEENIRVETVVVCDDVATPGPASPEKINMRRGVAGMFFVFKCAGAAAEEMMPLKEVKRVAEKTCANLRSMGVALSPCIVPRVGKSSFSIGEDEMEIGMGVHGEIGIRRGKLLGADDITQEILEPVISDIPYKAGDEVAVLINGLGATPLEEQFVVCRKVSRILQERGIRIYRYFIGEFVTSLEMAGLSISLLKVDDELKRLVDAPANTVCYKQH